MISNEYSIGVDHWNDVKREIVENFLQGENPLDHALEGEIGDGLTGVSSS